MLSIPQKPEASISRTIQASAAYISPFRLMTVARYPLDLLFHVKKVSREIRARGNERAAMSRIRCIRSVRLSDDILYRSSRLPRQSRKPGSISRRMFVTYARPRRSQNAEQTHACVNYSWTARTAKHRNTRFFSRLQQRRQDVTWIDRRARCETIPRTSASALSTRPTIADLRIG
jgi:hypothetical protein